VKSSPSCVYASSLPHQSPHRSSSSLCYNEPTSKKEAHGGRLSWDPRRNMRYGGRDSSGKSTVVVVCEFVGEEGWGGGGEVDVGDGWGRRDRRGMLTVRQCGGMVVARRFDDSWTSIMGSEIDTMGRRWPLDGEWDTGGGWARLQRRKRKKVAKKKKTAEGEISCREERRGRK